MRLRISSDGTPQGTRILDENGERVKGVTEVSWRLPARSMAEACVHLAWCGVDVETEARFFIGSREVAAIEYADGERVEYKK